MGMADVCKKGFGGSRRSARRDWTRQCRAGQRPSAYTETRGWKEDGAGWRGPEKELQGSPENIDDVTRGGIAKLAGSCERLLWAYNEL